jgi:hypothetical protein
LTKSNIDLASCNKRAMMVCLLISRICIEKNPLATPRDHQESDNFFSKWRE